MRLMFAALLILSLLGSACTNVESAGEVVVDVSAGGDVGSDGVSPPDPDTSANDGGSTSDLAQDLAGGDAAPPAEDTTSKDAVSEDSAADAAVDAATDVTADSIADAALDATPDIPEGCEDGGCFMQPCDEPSDCFSGICVPHLGGKMAKVNPVRRGAYSNSTVLPCDA